MRNLVLATALISIACSTPSPDVRKVTHDEYAQIGSCWTNEYGNFESFIVFSAVRDGQAAPNFISYKCIVKSDYADKALATIDNLPSIYVASAGDYLRNSSKGEVPFDVISNVPTDQLPPTTESFVYVFRGKLALVGNKYMNNLNKIEKIFCIKRTNVKLESFSKMPTEDRWRLFITEANCK